jgi:hypothetical protein
MLRPCLDCGRLSPRTRCAVHTRARDLARGTRIERGYGQEHRAERARWAESVALGGVACARCGALILPGEAWDLGHSDDRTRWTGPEHARCNRAAPHRRHFVAAAGAAQYQAQPISHRVGL